MRDENHRRRGADVFRSIALLLLVELFLPPAIVAEDSGVPSEGEPVAVVAGQPIYERDLAPLMSGQIQKLKNQEYEIKSQTLQDLVQQKLLEAEAKRKGIATDELLQQVVDSTIPEPSDSETEAYYQALKDQQDRPFAEIKDQLRLALKQARIRQARQEYLQRLSKESNVSILLSPPKIEMSYDPAHVRGDPKAPVTIVEFSDFECPFCGKAFPIVKELLAKYAGRVKLAMRDFPLVQIHPHAETAAEAARCAGEQVMFWEYHDMLFSNQDKLDQSGLIQDARAVGLDEKAFESCLASGKFRSAIEEDMKTGFSAGIGGTPAFFINGVLITGAQPKAIFEQKIEERLAQISQSPSIYAQSSER